MEFYFMCEKHAQYSSSTAITVEAFRNRPCSLPLSHPGHLPPTPEEVRALRQLLGYPQARLGSLLGKTYSKKGCKAVRRWETHVDSKEYVPINYCAWQLMLLAANVISITDLIDASSQYKDLLNLNDIENVEDN
ncbi:hypothetical protein IZT73_06770 [Aliivibrio fischeri]|nr:hypothetical protein [Aliivibrio fischeri]MBP3155237.1 hypothetical protein [Aliivibrio fischeri]